MSLTQVGVSKPFEQQQEESEQFTYKLKGTSPEDEMEIAIHADRARKLIAENPDSVKPGQTHAGSVDRLLKVLKRDFNICLVSIHSPKFPDKVLNYDIAPIYPNENGKEVVKDVNSLACFIPVKGSVHGTGRPMNLEQAENRYSLAVQRRIEGIEADAKNKVQQDKITRIGNDRANKSMNAEKLRKGVYMEIWHRLQELGSAEAAMKDKKLSELQAKLAKATMIRDIVTQNHGY